jgi:hypothetical protein
MKLERFEELAKSTAESGVTGFDCNIGPVQEETEFGEICLKLIAVAKAAQYAVAYMKHSPAVHDPNSPRYVLMQALEELEKDPT